MFKESQSALFMRLLAEAYEIDCLVRKAFPSLRRKTGLNKTKKRLPTDLHALFQACEPLDCVQLMAVKVRETPIG